MRVTVIGAGYVGLTTGVALAYLGHDVSCIDVDHAKIAALQEGRVPIHEPGLDEAFEQVSSRMRFAATYEPDLVRADVVLICVGTPPQDNGDADLSYVESAAESVARAVQPGQDLVIVNKSTVPVGSARRVRSIFEVVTAERGVDVAISVASNPEFLREGSALFDTFFPDRIVVGADESETANVLRALYEPVLEQTFTPPPGLTRPEAMQLPTFVMTNPTSAELVKYASNAFLAMKISFANELAGIADRVGADITGVVRAVGIDRRIGGRYLRAGAGWGGSCFGKDLRALLALGDQYGYTLPLASATITVNERQRQVIVDKLQAALKVIRGSTIALWGLSFKPGTDDLRDAPAIEVARRLAQLGARVRAYDPVAMERAQREEPDLAIEYADSPLACARGADAVVMMTEWDEFLHVNWEVLADVIRQRIIVDGRNVLDPDIAREKGFTYLGVGR